MLAYFLLNSGNSMQDIRYHRPADFHPTVFCDTSHVFLIELPPFVLFRSFWNSILEWLIYISTICCLRKSTREPDEFAGLIRSLKPSKPSAQIPVDFPLIQSSVIPIFIEHLVDPDISSSSLPLAVAEVQDSQFFFPILWCFVQSCPKKHVFFCHNSSKSWQNVRFTKHSIKIYQIYT